MLTLLALVWSRLGAAISWIPVAVSYNPAAVPEVIRRKSFAVDRSHSPSGKGLSEPQSVFILYSSHFIYYFTPHHTITLFAQDALTLSSHEQRAPPKFSTESGSVTCRSSLRSPDRPLPGVLYGVPTSCWNRGNRENELLTKQLTKLLTNRYCLYIVKL